ncbi:hypothetical protein [Streptomyces sp. KN37]|uniref:hypothetical protein n=1 Tax=Streptomyces sp. KN37 TaxID=3090667 RepID=UPI002A75F352|nr:hypothetical protein [Streptomyces sp. KN37]WPO69911.1 hypothetical protein R9806_04340 [Streptomyces sp. KN37]
MPVQDQEVSVSAPHQIEGEADGVATVDVSLRPAEHPEFSVTFVYAVRDSEILFPAGMRVEPAHGVPSREWSRLGAGLIKDLPVARWERAARAAADAQIAGATTWTWQTPSDQSEATRLAEAIVREMNPALDPNSGKAAARRWKRLVRLAEVVNEHDAARARGAKSPAGEVAEARGVEPSTVRSWLTQAKQEGIAPGVIPFKEFERRFPGLVEHVVVRGDGTVEDRTTQ